MVLHGAGSRKENHADFARLATANGFVALTFDNRGHGETEGDLDPSVVDDLRLLAEWLAARPEVDARRSPRAVRAWGLLADSCRCCERPRGRGDRDLPGCAVDARRGRRRIAEGRPPPRPAALAEMRMDAPALAGWLETSDVGDAVRRMGASRSC
jgi:hypothetical protein